MPRSLKAFTLIEIMVVVTIIGMTAMLGVPQVQRAAERTRATTAASDLRKFTDAIEFYSTANGEYPGDMTHESIPEDIASYLPQSWESGAYSWFYQNSDDFTYVYVYGLDFSTEQALHLDSTIDDGNIATGDVRIALNGTGLIYLFRT
ncbi:MAG: type II secretion system protein [Opitutales bacterium]